jgi:ribonuclease D
LVWQITGRKLEKAYTYTDWSHRPLTSEPLAYAIEDVQFLFPLHDHLLRRLQSLGRLEWAQEEFARLQASIGVTATDPRERYRRIRGWENLKPQQAAVLRELAVWRDAVAQRRNLPRGRVMRDEVLIELARKSPRTIEGMKGTRGLTRGDIEKWGEAILAAIQRGLATPPPDVPAVSPVRRPRADSAGLVELLQAVLKARAFDQDIAPTLLATAADLQELVEAGPEREARNLPILYGWRRTLAGELLLQVLEGKVSISVDRQRKKLILTPHP